MMTKKGNHSGLVLITRYNEIVLLQANKSYSERINRHLRFNKDLTFVERISIPRGRRDVGELAYETAVREFIEETGYTFDKVYMYKEPFTLQWYDDHTMYRYTMFVAFLDGDLHSLNTQPNSFEIHMSRRTNHPNDYNVGMRVQRYHTNEHYRKPKLMDYDEYVEYMVNGQLKTYAYSNYSQLFDFIDTARQLFIDNCRRKFFPLTLNWVYLLMPSKYNKRCVQRPPFFHSYTNKTFAQ